MMATICSATGRRRRQSSRATSRLSGGRSTRSCRRYSNRALSLPRAPRSPELRRWQPRRPLWSAIRPHASSRCRRTVAARGPHPQRLLPVSPALQRSRLHLALKEFSLRLMRLAQWGSLRHRRGHLPLPLSSANAAAVSAHARIPEYASHDFWSTVLGESQNE